MKLKKRKLLPLLLAVLMAAALLPYTMLSGASTVSAQSSTQTLCEYLDIDYSTWLTRVKNYSDEDGEYSDYYLGTAYPTTADREKNGSYDFRSPHGDNIQSFYTSDGWSSDGLMQCTGFVWHMLWKAGADKSMIPHLGADSDTDQWADYGWNTLLHYSDANLEYYDYSTKSEMLSSGNLDYGDLIMIWDLDSDGNIQGTSDYHHIGIYVGDGSSDLWWASDGYENEAGAAMAGENNVGTIQGKASSCSYTIIKMGEGSGTLTVEKDSANTDITDDNDLYSLSGAAYTVYTDSGCTTAATDIYGDTVRLVCDADGTADEAELSPGTYYIKETASGTGYALDDTVYTVTLESGEEEEFSVTDEPVTDPVGYLLQKANAESEENVDLSGAVYQIRFYTNYTASGTAERTWYFETDEDGSIYLLESYLSGSYASDAFYYDTNGIPTLPLGSISVQEVSPPDDFLLDGTVYTAVIALTSDETDAQLTWSDDSTGRLVMTNDASEEYAVHNEFPARGDLILFKTDADGNGMEYIPFLVTRTWTDADGETQTESQIIVTDEDGWFISSERDRTTDNTNVFDVESHVSGMTWLGTDEELAEGASYNIWFGDPDDMEDGKGSLLYGTYTIQELRCTANAGQTLLSRTFTLENTDEDGIVKTIEDDDEICFVSAADLTVTIDTAAVNTATGSKIVYAAEAAAVTDTVTIDNLSSAASYKVYVDFADEDGVSTGSAWSDEFTVSSTSAVMTIDVNVTVDVSSYTDGGTITALVYLYQVIDGEAYLIAQHDDLTDEDEQLYIPSMSTSAMDSSTQDQVGTVSDTASVIDTVSYTNLEAGENYRLEATLVDADGNVYGTASEDFHVYADTAANRHYGFTLTTDTVTMPEITLDSSTLAGVCLYVNEDLYLVDYDDDDNEVLTLVISHDSAALGDEDQMIYYPDVQTNAAASDTGDQTANETSDVVDYVTLTNLIAGEEYTLSGSLHYAADYTDADGGTHYAAETIDSSLIAAYYGEEEYTVSDDGTVTFTAADTEMMITLTFDVDMSLLGGATIVVFEDLLHNDTVAAAHADVTDTNQYVYVPAVHTTAVDQDADKGEEETVSVSSPAGTGDSDMPYLCLLIALAGAAAAAGILMKRRHKKCDGA